MEAWKLINFTSLSEVSPAFTLGYTAQQWGLLPFPANLYATKASASEILQSSDGVLGFGMPYSCLQYGADFYRETGGWYVLELHGYTGITSDRRGDFFHDVNDTISRNTTVCDEDATCTDLGCIILIEQAGRATQIVAIAHVLTIIILAVLTLIAAWVLRRDGSPRRGVQPADLNGRYLPPVPWRFKGKAEEIPMQRWTPAQIVLAEHETLMECNPQEFTKAINNCQDLLREMFQLDQQIMGMVHIREDDEHIRRDLKRRANELFEEVRDEVRNLSRIEHLTEEQTQVLDEISKLVMAEKGPRY
ncbi:hypothetical protein FKW77_007191 [Venturia effusa]|uniref:Uncharacterized protein n=1 Tax=Venturia effusa TaxID=50376 RepID=A0A517LJ41_9PEZI|nr:hypothetical protein FKW77_007191 [Venturia effusa]